MFKKDPLLLSTYRTYGTQDHLYILGRALEDEELRIREEQSLFRTIKNTYKQLETDEIPNVKIEFQLSNELSNLIATTDAEGYYKFNQKVDADLLKMTDEDGWINYFVSFKDLAEKRKIANDNLFSGEFLVPPATAQYGVISDIDDTILKTGVTSFLKWRVLHNSLFKNAYDRIALEGAAEFYQKLHQGQNNNQNPIFYLSNSPWNLYQYLKLFLDSNHFPKGPILLRNFKTPFDKFRKPEKPHKQKEILNILKTYPQLKFILIGDSGEHDPTIYTEIAAQFPHRILAIYLRSVKHRKKMEKVQAIVDAYKTTPLLLVNDSKQAEEHARVHQFIN